MIARYDAHLTIHFKNNSHTLLELSACSCQVLAVLIEAMVYVGIRANPVGAANVPLEWLPLLQWFLLTMLGLLPFERLPSEQLRLEQLPLLQLVPSALELSEIDLLRL